MMTKQKMEDLRGKRGGRLKHCTVDGDVPICLRKNVKDSNDDISSKGKKHEEKKSGRSTPGKTKHCFMNKTASGRIIDTEYINVRAITTAIMVNRQHIKLMSVNFPHSKYADHHIEKMYKTIVNHKAHCNKYIPIIGGDFNAEMGLGKGTECKSVGRYTLNESNKRGDWLKSWLMLQD